MSAYFLHIPTLIFLLISPVLQAETQPVSSREHHEQPAEVVDASMRQDILDLSHIDEPSPPVLTTHNNAALAHINNDTTVHTDAVMNTPTNAEPTLSDHQHSANQPPALHQAQNDHFSSARTDAVVPKPSPMQLETQAPLSQAPVHFHQTTPAKPVDATAEQRADLYLPATPHAPMQQQAPAPTSLAQDSTIYSHQNTTKLAPTERPSTHAQSTQSIRRPVTPSLTHQASIHSTSPWEKFLINTVSILHYCQHQAQHYFSVLFSKQGIPLLIIVFGVLILNMVVWFAYISFKKEQAQKIKSLMQNKSTTPQTLSDKPEPLSLAYAEESSGDYDVFATSEGIPIKLDLAQAYVNMGDNDNARIILEDIIHQHRGKIVQAAQTMLKKITDG